MQNEWRMPDSSPYFLVSENGEVRNAGTKLLIKQHDNGHGYKYVYAKINNKQINRYVHRLVAECFVENPQGYQEVNHKDGNKENNNAWNLEWCTRSYNIHHSYMTGIRKTTEKQKEASRKNAENSKQARKKGWYEWAKTEKAKEQMRENFKKAQSMRWVKKAKEEN